jgi:hypothetical protein
MEKTRHGKGTRNKENSRNYWKLATWNIRGLSGKENELIEECQKNKSRHSGNHGNKEKRTRINRSRKRILPNLQRSTDK